MIRLTRLSLLTIGVALALLTLTPAIADVPSKTPAFRYHLFKEPESLAPFEQKNSNAGYVLSQVMSPLIRWQDGQFEKGLAERCYFASPLVVRCTLRTNLMYSDGTPLRPADFIQHFEQILNPKNQTRVASELFAIVGAEELFLKKTGKGKVGPKLGVKVVKNDLVFQLKEPQSEFLHRLTSPLLSPYKGEVLRKGKPVQFIGTGPYRIASWDAGRQLRLDKNPHSLEGTPDRPSLEVLFISEDSVALKLYQSGELQFLRRLPSAFIPTYRGKPDYHEIEQIRFDYFGFSKSFRDKPKALELQQATAFSIPYSDMQTLFQAKPRPGCFGLPAAWTGGQICFDRDLKRARDLLKSRRAEQLKNELLVTFSQSVDDHRRAIEWLQLKLDEVDLKLRLEGAETKVFLDRLEKREASFFRRGLAPDRPTCAAVLENFIPGAPENYLDWDSPRFTELVQRLQRTLNEKEKVKICREAVVLLKESFIMIPTGPIFFSVLASPQFSGWHLNELNQLDLKDLRFTAQPD